MSLGLMASAPERSHDEALFDTQAEPTQAGLGAGTLVAAPTVEWLTSMGMNALAGWVGNLAADGLRTPFAGDQTDPDWIA